MIRASAAVTLLLLCAVVTAWAWEVERRDQFYAAGGYYPVGSPDYYYYHSYHPGWFTRWFWFTHSGGYDGYGGYNGYSGYGYHRSGNIYIDNRTYTNNAPSRSSSGGFAGAAFNGAEDPASHLSTSSGSSAHESSSISRGGFGAIGHSSGAHS